VLVLLSCVVSNSAQQIDLAKARELLYVTYSSYCPAATLQSWTCYWCTSSVNVTVVDTIYDQSSNNFGFVGYTRNEIVVTFRGTVVTSIKNWIKDLQFATTQLPSAPKNVEVHVGFLKSWNSLKNGIITAVGRAVERTGFTKIMITGHSLGGAIGTLASVDLLSIFRNSSISLWTYGCPRVGNSAWNAYFATLNTPTARLVNNKDIVPHIPPRFVYNYHHVATEVWYNSNAFVFCDTSGEDPACSNSLLLATSVDDHLSYFQVNLHDGIPYSCGGLVK